MATRKLSKRKSHREIPRGLLSALDTQIVTLFRRLPAERRRLVLKFAAALKADQDVPGRPLLSWFDGLPPDDPKLAEKLRSRLRNAPAEGARP